jgi:hypothetical protein
MILILHFLSPVPETGPAYADFAGLANVTTCVVADFKSRLSPLDESLSFPVTVAPNSTVSTFNCFKASRIAGRNSFSELIISVFIPPLPFLGAVALASVSDAGDCISNIDRSLSSVLASSMAYDSPSSLWQVTNSRLLLITTSG